MPKLVVVARRFIDAENKPCIGGVETYIRELAKVFASEYEVVIVQEHPERVTQVEDGCVVEGFDVRGVKDLVHRVKRTVLSRSDTVLFSTDQYAASARWEREVVIQHGVYWDLPLRLYRSNTTVKLAATGYKWVDNIRNLRRIAKFKNIVCVDYVYLTWLRCHQAEIDQRVWVVPNCAARAFGSVRRREWHRGDGVKILFARRLERIRGTDLLCEIAPALLSRYSQVKVTICGCGSELQAMQECLPGGGRVEYTCREHSRMPEIMADHDIVIIPSHGSEGTTFAAIEAMASGCCVLASNVGGLTSLIIDGFNGLLFEPTPQDVIRACVAVIENPRMRTELAENGRSVAASAFTPERWAASWRGVLADL